MPGEALASGAGASRLVTGNHPAHEGAERVIADWLQTESALLFSSGYAANVGLISSLAGPRDVVVSDALNHASIIDGCRLSGARVVVVPHLDVSAVERALASAEDAARRWVVTESYFSMDGDSPDLAALRAGCDEHGAGLIVDEAHAIGVFGPAGRGLCAAAGVRPDVVVGGGGKALGLSGAFVAGPAVLRAWLWNRARSFVFSTGIPPLHAHALAVRAKRAAADEEGRERLRTLCRRFAEGLRALGWEGTARGPIFPWVLGPAETAARFSSALSAHGVRVLPIRPPTVPSGTSRLRISLHAALSDDDLDLALRAFRSVLL